MLDKMTTIRWENDADGVLTLTMDDPDQGTNTANAAWRASMRAAMDRLEDAVARGEVTGVILTSAKKTFFAGGDLKALIRARREDAPAVAADIDDVKHQFRRLETCGRPVVAAINGAALGGGLELALACHHRVALDVPGSLIGLPEVGLGLLPGGGGVTRSVRLLGLRPALELVLLHGQRYAPGKALEVGLVDEVAPDPDAMIAAGRAWIRENPAGSRRPDAPEPADGLSSYLSGLREQVEASPMPAPRAILTAAVDGARLDLEDALALETRLLVDLIVGQVSKNMIQGSFFDLQAVNAGARRPTGYARHKARRVAVLGAGTAASGVARLCTKAGLEVVLTDVPGEVTGADVVVVADAEDRGLERKVLDEVEEYVAADAVLAVTSSGPITELAAGRRHPERFVGLHFLQPVDRMPLMEIVCCEHTAPATLAKAFDIVRGLRKTPIVVRDSVGFFAGRVTASFLDEAATMVGEGVGPEALEEACARAGYAVGVLALLDERLAGLQRHTSAASGTRRHAGLADLQDRLLFVQALEAVRCLDEGVLGSAEEANVGSLLGLGYPAWTGGVVQYIRQYEGGPPGFAARARELADRHGERFSPPACLVVQN